MGAHCGVRLPVKALFTGRPAAFPSLLPAAAHPGSYQHYGFARAEPEEQPARFVAARGQCRGSAEGGAHARHHSSVSTCLLEQRGERAP